VAMQSWKRSAASKPDTERTKTTQEAKEIQKTVNQLRKRKRAAGIERFSAGERFEKKDRKTVRPSHLATKNRGKPIKILKSNLNFLPPAPPGP